MGRAEEERTVKECRRLGKKGLGKSEEGLGKKGLGKDWGRVGKGWGRRVSS